MADQEMHGSSRCIVNSTDDIQLEIKRKAFSGDLNCHVFVIADQQFNVMDRQKESVQE